MGSKIDWGLIIPFPFKGWDGEYEVKHIILAKCDNQPNLRMFVGSEKIESGENHETTSMPH